MRFIFTLVIICSALFAHSQILKKTYYDWQKTQPDEVYYVNAQGQYNGLYTKYNYDGAKAVEATFLNGVKNGSGKEYYTRGALSKLKISGSYKNDEKHGQWITYTYVKYGQSYYDIMQSMAFNDKEADIFNTGIQTKVIEETFNNGSCTKETKYHLNGKVFYTANFVNRSFTGDYVCYNDKGVTLAKGKIGQGGKMVGLWVIPREENGDCPRDKYTISNVTYTQKIKFDENGNVDTNFMNKSYYLSGKLRDSVRLYSLEYTSGYSNGKWYLCGKNMAFGKYKKYYENGKLMEDGQYNLVNGKSRQVGIWKYYNQDGTSREEKDYDALLLQEKQEKEKADSIKKDHTEKIETWFDLYNKANDAYVKLINLYTIKNIDKPTTYKKPKLFPYFQEINKYYFGTNEAPISTINKLFPMKLSDFAVIINQTPQTYFSSIENLKKITDLIPKMILCSDNNTKDLENQLETSKSIEEKIKILENYQFDPK